MNTEKQLQAYRMHNGAEMQIKPDKTVLLKIAIQNLRY